MSQEKFTNKEAIQKLKHLVDNIDICLFCTAIQNGDLHAAPMSRQEVDDEGNIFFLANAESETCKNIEKDKNVALHFSKVSEYEFLAVSGSAKSYHDQALIDKYWNKFMEGWFEKGKEDPSIRIIEVKPNNARFWETKDGKMITFLKVAANAITGSNFETGVEGKIEI
jgi:general stress protein 26